MRQITTCTLLIIILLAYFVLSAHAGVVSVSGRLTSLRVHDVGTVYGSKTNRFNVEVVFKLKGHKKSFGFQLRNDKNLPVRQGMLDILRDAFNNDYLVTISYSSSRGREYGAAYRISITKPFKK